MQKKSGKKRNLLRLLGRFWGGYFLKDYHWFKDMKMDIPICPLGPSNSNDRRLQPVENIKNHADIHNNMYQNKPNSQVDGINSIERRLSSSNGKRKLSSCKNFGKKKRKRKKGGIWMRMLNVYRVMILVS